ncbi:hypothetical protein LWI28_011918 [Acer negundo]|uniref:GAG-pre-integrase domain-containing protein n=1 Tax=Acer negundo TaxID=4023 RepID=A0AAD5IV51_ACENE|nr:hypothetical protein LWI28_011918 [Acer negundo]
MEEREIVIAVKPLSSSLPVAVTATRRRCHSPFAPLSSSLQREIRREEVGSRSDNSHRESRRLTDVRYVPDLKKNLISLGVLDSSGYKVTMEGGVLKVVRGAFLAMKGTRQRNLYFLDGYTVTGRATVSSSSDDEASDTSRLWHMRLGHVGEKALQGLVKQGLLKGAKTEALMYASHIVNRLPASALDGKTPKEVWSRQPVSDYDRLHIFGCPAYFHVTESKLDPRAKKAVFVGFSEGVKGFRLWNSESKKIILSRDVTFDESAMLKQTLQDIKNENPNSLQQVEFEFPKKSEKVSPTVDGPDDQDEISVEVEDSAPLSEIRQQPESIATSRPKRDIRKPARYTDMVAYALPVTDVNWINTDVFGSLAHVKMVYDIRELLSRHGNMSVQFCSRASNSFVDDLEKKGSNMVGDMVRWGRA